MNLELKALLSLVFDALTIAEDAVAKANAMKLISDSMMLIGDLPAAIIYWNDLQAEIKALPGTAQQQDLIAFIKAKLAGVSGGINNEKAIAILNASLKLVEDMVSDGLALSKAILS